MTEKICRTCGTYQTSGYYCENCGQQLFPDIGGTIWEWKRGIILKVVEKPRFNRWSGKEIA